MIQTALFLKFVNYQKPEQAQKKIFAQKGNILIDDRPENIEAWESEGGIGILHKNARDTINEIKKLRSPLKLVEESLENA